MFKCDGCTDQWCEYPACMETKMELLFEVGDKVKPRCDSVHAMPAWYAGHDCFIKALRHDALGETYAELDIMGGKAPWSLYLKYLTHVEPDVIELIVAEDKPKGYEPDGFDANAHRDFMRNL